MEKLLTPFYVRSARYGIALLSIVAGPAKATNSEEMVETVDRSALVAGYSGSVQDSRRPMNLKARSILVVVAVSLCLGATVPSWAQMNASDLAARVRLLGNPRVALRGESTVSVRRVGMKPVKNTEAELSLDPAGDYLWRADPSGWAIVRHFDGRIAGANGGRRFAVQRPQGSDLYCYQVFVTDARQVFAIEGWLTRDFRTGLAGPGLGRNWQNGTVADLIDKVQNPAIHEIPGVGIRLDGDLGQERVAMTFDPAENYFPTKLEVSYAHSKVGYDVDRVSRIEGFWYAAHGTLFEGAYSGETLLRGTEATIENKNVSLETPKNAVFVPEFPVGSIVGSERDDKIYRVDPKEKLVYWGMKGRRLGVRPYFWGDLFVVAGAGLLLTCLYLVVSRKRSSGSPG